MCTSLTLQSQQQHHFLARTMDFDFELAAHPIFIPREHTFTSDLGTQYSTKYGFIGTGRNVGDNILIDGVNEHGLSGAALYLNESVYQTQPNTDTGKINLATHEVLNWLLGNLREVTELTDYLPQLNIVGIPNRLLQISVPLHWLLADRTGNCYVLEAHAEGLKLIENPVGVLTNSPEFEWHLRNLQNYTQLQPTPHPQRIYHNLTVKDLGPGSGTLGLPGDYTSTARFIRASFLRGFAAQPANDLAAINTLCHILNNVDIVKGVKLMADGTEEYTQYRAYFNLETTTYYLQPYQDQTIYSLNLADYLLTATRPLIFSIPQQQTIQPLATPIIN
ncbi:choloylglycine hydrolase family protein [Lapidilactobacillus bayanensis]|uniref:choloylglycine hydrolase family protein n=1 Tax=Lapidilactobacillus bayanensis TaxID=2485998 RepID=UPI000F79CB90|nr:choloylglycine hydrolase family protein [Lapidilactobacillus bayanensis]